MPTLSGPTRIAPQPTLASVTLSGTPNTLTKVTLPAHVEQLVVTVLAIGTDAYLTWTGNDADPLGAHVPFPIRADDPLELDKMKFAGGATLPFFCIGSETGSQEVRINLGWR